MSNNKHYELGSQTRYQLTTRLLQAFASSVRENGSQFILVSRQFHHLTRLNRQKLDEDGIPIIEIGPLWKEGEDPNTLYFKNDGHWTKFGHQRLAEYLAPKLIKIISEFKDK